MRATQEATLNPLAEAANAAILKDCPVVFDLLSEWDKVQQRETVLDSTPKAERGFDFQPPPGYDILEMIGRGGIRNLPQRLRDFVAELALRLDKPPGGGRGRGGMGGWEPRV